MPTTKVQQEIEALFQQEDEKGIEASWDAVDLLQINDPSDILSKLLEKHESGEIVAHPILCFGLISRFAELAEFDDVESMLEILGWEEVLSESDRSIRGVLWEALKRMGDASIVPGLRTHAEAVKRVEYEDYDDGERHIPAAYYHQLDQSEIADVISACTARGTHSRV